jgi:hypothetical protein
MVEIPYPSQEVEVRKLLDSEGRVIGEERTVTVFNDHPFSPPPNDDEKLLANKPKV